MATDLQSPPTTAKFEAFVEGELTKVRRRIRFLDAGRSLLLLFIVTVGYFLCAAVFDLIVGGSDATGVNAIRIVGFLAYIAAAVFFIVQFGLRLYRQINPYYAARQLEDTLPDAKNSVINWLDLRSRKLPGAIRVALGLRAARDLKQADTELAVNPKTNWLLGGILAALVFGILILFATGPKRFGSLFNRAFAPLGGETLGKRTGIKLLAPPEGNVTVPLNQAVRFEAEIDGRFPPMNQPGAPRVLYRYSKNDIHVALDLEETTSGTWSVVMPPDRVQSGFFYKIAAGDAETAEYEVQARSNPQAIKYDVTYHFRPYRKLDDERVTFPGGLAPRLIEMRGTEVSLVITTNHKLKEGFLEIDTKAEKTKIPAEILADNPQAMRLKFKLEESGTARLLFTTSDGKENIDRRPWPIEVLGDGAPNVVLTLPGKDVTLPANGTLQLEGLATDDFGIKKLTLQLRLVDAAGHPVLAGKAFREDKPFQFDDGTFPDRIDYKDFLALEQIKTAKGDAYPLKKGMVLEYWLEALDNSDYPEPNGNVGQSKTFKVNIDAAMDEKKQQEERKQAEAQQKKNDQKQDQAHGQENDKRKQERADKGKSEEEKAKESAERQKDLERKADELRKRDEELQKEIEKQKKQEESKGAAKGDDNRDKGDAKPGPDSKENQGEAKGNKPPTPDQAGKNKNEGKEGQGNSAGESKDAGQKEKGQQNGSETKGPGKENPPTADAKGADQNNQGAQADPKKGTSKDDANQGKQPPGNVKNEGNKSEEKTGQAKKDGGPKAGQNGAESKGQDVAKDGPAPQNKGDKQGTGQNPQAGKADSKKGPNDQMAKEKGGGLKDVPPGEHKSAGNADHDPNQAQVKGQGPMDDPGKAQAKEGDGKGKNGPAAGAKGEGGKNGVVGNPKDAIPDQAKASGQTKDDNLANGDRPFREPTDEEIAELEKKLQREEQAPEAMLDLKRIAKESKNPELKKTANDLMEKSGKPIPGDEPKVKETKNSTDGPGQSAGKEGPKGEPGEASKSKDGTPQKADAEAKGQQKDDPKIEQGEGKSGGSYAARPGTGGLTDDSKGTDPNLEFAKRGGNLQLENLKNLPDSIKNKVFPTEKEWQQYLKDRQAYEDLLRRQQASAAAKDKHEMKGGTSTLPGQRPRPIAGNSNNQSDPLQSTSAQPPPEFREAQQRFTNRPPR